MFHSQFFEEIFIMENEKQLEKMIVQLFELLQQQPKPDYSNLIVSDAHYYIPDIYKTYAIRINNEEKVPFSKNPITWPKSGSIESTGEWGLFGVLLTQEWRYIKDMTYFIPFPKYMILEIDKRDIINKPETIDTIEVEFKKCNILFNGDIRIFLILLIQYATPEQYGKMIDLISYKISDIEFAEKSKENEASYKNTIINKIGLARELVKTQKNKTSIHGLQHIKNVERNGNILAKSTNADLVVIHYFAVYHDKCRENESFDPEHGLRASILIEKERNTVLKDLNDTQIELLKYACKNHTHLHKSNDITINTCFDADRLDLTRIGCTLNPSKMATDIGTFYASNTEKFKECVKTWNL